MFKKLLLCFLAVLSLSVLAQNCSNNLNFEQGLTGWNASATQNGVPVPVSTKVIETPAVAYLLNQNKDLRVRALIGVDTVFGKKSVRVGYSTTGLLFKQNVSKVFVVDSLDPFITYRYALVFNDVLGGADQPSQFPYFKAKITNMNDSLIPHSYMKLSNLDVQDFYNIGNSINGFHASIDSFNLPYITYLFWSDWRSATIDLSAYKGQQLKLSFETSNCAHGDHYAYAYVDVVCGSMSISPATPSLNCNTGVAELTAPPGFKKYLWTPTGDTTQNITVNFFGYYTVTTIDDKNDSLSYTTFVGPAATVAVTLASFNNVCSVATPFTLTGGQPVGGIYSGTGVTSNVFDPAVAGVGTHSITYTYTDSASGCTQSRSKDLVVDICMGVSIADKATYKLYQLNDQLVFEGVNSSMKGYFKLYDVTGRTLLNEKLDGKPELRMPVGELYMGTYFYTIGEQVRGKLILKH